MYGCQVRERARGCVLLLQARVLLLQVVLGLNTCDCFMHLRHARKSVCADNRNVLVLHACYMRNTLLPTPSHPTSMRVFENTWKQSYTAVRR